MDGAYNDVALEFFGQGVKCHRAGSLGTKHHKRDFQAQSEHAGEYTEVLLQETSDKDTVTGTKRESEETLAKDGLSSSFRSEIETNKNEEQQRCKS